MKKTPAPKAPARTRIQDSGYAVQKPTKQQAAAAAKKSVTRK